MGVTMTINSKFNTRKFYFTSENANFFVSLATPRDASLSQPVTQVLFCSIGGKRSRIRFSIYMFLHSSFSEMYQEVYY